MEGFPQRVDLGRSGLNVSRLGLGSSFGAPVSAYREAFDRGVNYFYWGSLRRSMMAEAIREISRTQREEIVVVIQSYARSAAWMEHSLERALKRLQIDQADVLLLGWHNDAPSDRLLDRARDLVRRERVRKIALSSHRRTLFPGLLDVSDYSIWHLRYNAVHRGAEEEVFPWLKGAARESRPGVVTYTTTRWGHLCDPARIPEGEAVPSGTDCYRFALSRPEVDLCLAGPDDAEQMKLAVDALARGPMDDEELAWMRRVGDAIYRGDRTSTLRDGA